jgi:hypothetical protein
MWRIPWFLLIELTFCCDQRFFGQRGARFPFRRFFTPRSQQRLAGRLLQPGNLIQEMPTKSISLGTGPASQKATPAFVN